MHRSSFSRLTKRPQRRAIVWLALGAAALVVVGGIRAQDSRDRPNGFDLSGSLIPRSEILGGGPPRDGIPAINEPKFISAESGLTLYGANERGIVVTEGDATKFYPLAVLNWHEIVNDTIDETPISVTYCPLCGTGVVFSRRVRDNTLTFGVSGLLYQSDVLLYDRETDSLWSQLLRQGVTGKHKGLKLTVIPSRLETLGAALKRSSKAQVLSTETGFRRDYRRTPYADYAESPRLFFPVKHSDKSVPTKAWSLLIEIGKDALIVPVTHLPPAKKRAIVRVGRRRIKLSYDAAERVLNCDSELKGVTCISGYYFALRTFYPEARTHPKSEKR